jgi:hypothetical protein
MGPLEAIDGTPVIDMKPVLPIGTIGSIHPLAGECLAVGRADAVKGEHNKVVGSKRRVRASILESPGRLMSARKPTEEMQTSWVSA